LLLGYCYSHFVTKRLSSKQQWILHACLLGVALIFLPVQPSDVWKPAGTEDPTWRMLLLLGATIGFPFFLLSTTGPLIQAWQSKTHSDKSAYRLFAVSNFGSLLGLLGYPFLIEPYLRLGDQSLYWSIGFGVFGVLSLLSGWQLFGAQQEAKPTAATQTAKGDSEAPAANWLNCIVWTLLAFSASAMLLATTNQMCQEVASVPFLWVLPLSLYLITFIICFENPRWYIRWFFFLLMFSSSFIAIGILHEGASLPLPLQVCGYALVMFACCMTCHGELAQAKPAESDLTLFYLMVSVGGALGGIFVVIIAPRIFDAYFEFHASLALSIGLSVVAFLGYRVRKSGKQKSVKKEDEPKTFFRRAMAGIGREEIFAWFSIPLAIVAIAITVNVALDEQNDLNKSNVLYRTRNSYGTLHVVQYYDDDEPTSRSLVNGRIKHGAQMADSKLAVSPTSYYSPMSGVGKSIWHLRRLQDTGNGSAGKPGLHIGVVGLGTGTMAAWGDATDSFKFYEINPDVEKVAREFFTYLEDSKANKIEVVIGDARIQIEKRLEDEGSENFDLLVIDAFSSDAIPMHLLTRECFKLYCDNLSDTGILAVHVSNRYLDLGTIVYNLANELEYASFKIDNYKDEDDELAVVDFENGADESNWVLVTKNKELIQSFVDEDRYTFWDKEMASTVWTDDFGSLTDVMDFSNTTDFAFDKWDELVEYFFPEDEENEDGEGTEEESE